MEGYEIFLPGPKTADEDYEACRQGRLDQTRATVTLYDNLFKGYSQPGTSTVSIVTLSGYEYWKQYEKDYLAGRKTAYKKAKERLAWTFIEKVESRLIPKLKSMIEVMEIGTPLTNVRYTGNVQGSIYGFTGLFPYLNQLEVRTPVKGLYLASAWTHGGGYAPAMMAGRDAVLALLEDWKKV